MVLLLVSAVYSLRARPHSGVAPLAAAWGWTPSIRGSGGLPARLEVFAKVLGTA